MKNAIFNRLGSIILICFILQMFAFILGANAETEAVKNNYVLLMALTEIIIILSLIILFYTNKKN